MTIDAGPVRLAKALVVQVADDLTYTVLARLEIARVSHQVAEWTHVADVALACEFACLVVGRHALTVFTWVEVNAWSFCLVF